MKSMPPAGLCLACIWHKEVRSDRGSVFIMCRRGLTDPAWPKYPRLPVLTCIGFEPDATAARQPASASALS